MRSPDRDCVLIYITAIRAALLAEQAVAALEHFASQPMDDRIKELLAMATEALTLTLTL